MPKSLAYLIAVISLAMPCAAFADDTPPTTQERVGYALSRAHEAAHGDKQALASLQTDAAIPDAAAEFGLGEYHVFIKDYAQSIAWFQKSAGHGFVGGSYGLGLAYDMGQGVPRDHAEAMRQYLKATKLPDAEKRIGDLYAFGLGVKKDSAQALSWYRKAAQAGSIEADIALGLSYDMGVDAKRDDSQALYWYRKAADAGDAGAQYFVGRIYDRPGPLQDPKQAAEWYQKASQQGNPTAQLGLGLLYSSGKGVTADAGKAVQQFQMAANQGEPEAQAYLAQSFATGAGVPADPVRAYQWFTLAETSSRGQGQAHSMASAGLKELERQMTPAQVARAKQAADEWLKRHGA